MIRTPRHSVITSFLSRTKDRFHEYNEPKTLEERLETLEEIELVQSKGGKPST